MFNPRDFTQVDDGVNQQVMRTAPEWLGLQLGDRILDLSCGMGSFTLPLVTRAAHMVGAEGVPALVEEGRESVALNDLSNATLFHENLEEDITRQAWTKHSFDKVLLNLARVGMPDVMPHAIRLTPRRMVYVSCDLAMLARDSETLL